MEDVHAKKQVLHCIVMRSHRQNPSANNEGSVGENPGVQGLKPGFEAPSPSA